MTNSAASHLLSTVIADSEFSRKWPDTDLEVLEGYADDLQHYLLQLNVNFCSRRKWRHARCRARNLVRGVASWYFARMYPNSWIWPPVATSRMNDAQNTILECLKKVTVLIPLSRVMPELDLWLQPPTTGRIMKLPQASLRWSGPGKAMESPWFTANRS